MIKVKTFVIKFMIVLLFVILLDLLLFVFWKDTCVYSSQNEAYQKFIFVSK